jgi:hypothetical protein
LKIFTFRATNLGESNSTKHFPWLSKKLPPRGASKKTTASSKKKQGGEKYPLVNVQKTMENQHFQWENPL